MAWPPHQTAVPSPEGERRTGPGQPRLGAEPTLSRESRLRSSAVPGGHVKTDRLVMVLEGRRRDWIEVDPLLLDDQRALMDLRVDRPNVLTEEANEEELHCAEEVDPDDQRGEPEVERVPPDQLQREVDDRDEQGQDREREPGHRGEAQGNLRVAGDAQHRHVVQREEVVLGDALVSGWLNVLDLGPRIPEVADQAPEVRVLLPRGSELLNDLAVIQPEARKVVHELDV